MDYILLMGLLAGIAYCAVATLTYSYLEDVWYENEEDIGGPPLFGVMAFFASIWPIFFPVVAARGYYLFVQERRRARKAEAEES